jgi:hypothetical protein
MHYYVICVFLEGGGGGVQDIKGIRSVHAFGADRLKETNHSVTDTGEFKEIPAEWIWIQMSQT